MTSCSVWRGRSSAGFEVALPHRHAGEGETKIDIHLNGLGGLTKGRPDATCLHLGGRGKERRPRRLRARMGQPLAGWRQVGYKPAT